jgi:hypothetical protein
MRVRLLFGVAPFAFGIALNVPSFAQEPPIILSADWIGSPCRVPGKFRITLTNSSEASYSVPRRDTLGRGRTVNLISWLNDVEKTTENYFGPPPLTMRPEAGSFVELSPGNSHSFDVEFDGTFAAHGWPARGSIIWDRDIQFEYTLAAPSDFGAVSAFGPIRARDPQAPVRSNILRCP